MLSNGQTAVPVLCPVGLRSLEIGTGKTSEKLNTTD
jgi:hypothetical protein